MSRQRQLLEEAAAQNFDDVARGVDPDVHADLGYGTTEGVGRIIDLATRGETSTAGVLGTEIAVAEPPLTGDEEREVDRLVDQGRYNYGDARDQVIKARH